MPLVDFAILDPNPREEEIEVPCSATDPAAGTARLTFRELPAVEWSRLTAVYAGRFAACADLTRASAARRAELAAAHTGPEAALVEDILGEEFAGAAAAAQERLSDIQREIVSRGVVGHDPDTFRVDVDPEEIAAIPERLRAALLAHGLSPEEVERALADGVVRVRFRGATWRLPRSAEEHPGASPVTVRFYERVARGFLEVLVSTIQRLQRGRVLTPAEIWAANREKPAAEVDAGGEAAPDPLEETASPGSPSDSRS